MPYQYLPDTWGAAVVVTVVTLDRIIPGPGFDVFLSEGSQWNTAIGLRTTPMLGPLGSIMILFTASYFPVWDSLKINEKQIQPKSGGS